MLGVKAILAQSPQTRPEQLARSLAPLVHAATKAGRRMFYELYAEFVSAFRSAPEALRLAGIRRREPGVAADAAVHPIQDDVVGGLRMDLQVQVMPGVGHGDGLRAGVR